MKSMELNKSVMIDINAESSYSLAHKSSPMSALAALVFLVKHIS